jgi:ribonuclease Z
MRLTLLGTGCPVVSTDRYGPAALVETDSVEAGSARVLVDCGSGVTQRLLAAGCPGRALDLVLLTHLHSDHLVDLFQLIVSSWHQGRARPQRVVGPRGTLAYVEGLLALWKAELEQRIAHEKRPSADALEVEVEEIADGWTAELGDLRIAAFEVDHRPVRQAFGFSFVSGGKTAVISGDTRPCDALEAAARDCDLLVNEVFVHREMPVVPGVRSAETVENVAAYHTLSTEVGKLAARAGARALALTHFVPPAADRDALLAEVAADFPGPLVVGEDLMRFDLAAGTVAYGNARWRLGR